MNDRRPQPILRRMRDLFEGVFDEDQNRALMLVTDERAAQTANIVAAIAEAAAGIGDSDVVRIRAIHHAVQRLLPRCDVRIPFADNSTHKVPDGVTDEQMIVLADILPTSYEVGVLNGTVRPADVVAIVGAGPIGLAAILTARLFSPSHIVAIDLADSRLEAARKFGADIVVNSGRDDPQAVIAELTGGLGADVTMEAVGSPQTFELAVRLVRSGGHVANIGVHGGPATLHLEDIWIKNLTITTGLVDTYSTPTLIGPSSR